MLEYLSIANEDSATENNSALIEAAKNGQTEEVNTLIESGADIDFKDYYGRTALHWASHKGKTETIKALLEKGAGTEIICNDGINALQRAVVNNDAKTVKTILDFESDIDFKAENGRTALQMAAIGGYREIVEAFLNGGANVGITDSDGRTAVDLANRNNENDIAILLTPFLDEENCKKGIKEVIKPTTKDSSPLDITMDALTVVLEHRYKEKVSQRNTNEALHTRKRINHPEEGKNIKRKSSGKTQGKGL